MNCNFLQGMQKIYKGLLEKFTNHHKPSTFHRAEACTETWRHANLSASSALWNVDDLWWLVNFFSKMLLKYRIFYINTTTRMCDSGLTGFLYYWAPALPTAQYKNPVNCKSHIWRSPSRKLNARASMGQIIWNSK